MHQFDPEKIGSPGLRDLFDYWNRLRGTRFAPPRSELDPAAIPQLLPYICLVDVLTSPLQFRFRLAGSEIVERYGEEITGKLLKDMDFDDHKHEIFNEYKDVICNKTPVVQTYDYTKYSGKWLYYERILLPLSDDGETVNMLLLGAYPLSLEKGDA